MLLVGSDDGVYRVADDGGAEAETTQVLKSGRVVRLRTTKTVNGIFAATRTGLFWSADGKQWTDLTVPQEHVYSVATGPFGERLYAGTRPAHVYVAELNGDDIPAVNWHELDGLQDLPSREEWRLPRHENLAQVRDLHTDPAEEHRIIAGVEVGGVHVSDDGGETWTERMNGLDRDIHELHVVRAETGILDRLTTHASSGVQIKLRVDPMSRERSVAEFKRRIRDKNKTLYAKQQTAAPDTSVVADEKQELETVLRSLKSGNERIYWVGVYFVIRGQTKKKVDKAEDEITRELAKDDVTVTTADWVPKEGMTTVSPIGQFELSDTTRTPMTGSALGCLFPFSTTNMIEEDGILFGYHGLNASPVVVDRWNRRNGYNQLIIGNIGAGKSYGTKLLLLRRLVRDRDNSAVIVDPRGGFRSLIDAFGIEAETIEVSGNVGINPLQISPTPQEVLDERPDMDPFGERLQSVIAFFETFFASDEDDSGGLSPQERSVLKRAIITAYRNKGITSDPDTHRNKSPIISDVISTLREFAKDPRDALSEETSEQTVEKWADTASDLEVALEDFETGEGYGHLNQPTDIDLGRDSSKRVVLLDISQYEGTGEMPLTMKLLFDAIYERAKQPGKLIAAFDEAHQIMKSSGGLDWLERSVRYSRHFDLSLTLISQTADEFFVHSKAKTIADNCPIKWLFRTTGLDEEHGDKLGLTPREVSFAQQATPGDRDRGWSHSLLSVDGLGTVPIRVEALEGEEPVIDPAPAQADGGSEQAVDTGRFEF